MLYNAMLWQRPAADFSSAASLRLRSRAAPRRRCGAVGRNGTDLAILDGVGSTEMLHIYCSNTADALKP